MAAASVVGAVGEREQDGHRAQRPDQERGQVQGGLVGPVQVLDDEHHRPGLAQPLEQAEHQLEQLSGLQFLRRRGRGSARRELRKQPAQSLPGRPEQFLQPSGRSPARERAQRPDERRQRQALRAQFDALTRQNAESGRRRPARQLSDQPGLADPGLAADQDDGRIAILGAPQRHAQ